MGTITHTTAGNKLTPAEYDSPLSHKVGVYSDVVLRSPYSYVIAADDASDSVKAQADAVCDGTADDVEFQAAITAGQKDIVGSQGTFTFSSAVSVPDATSFHLRGMGAQVTHFVQSTANTDLFVIGATGVSASVAILLRDFSFATVAGTGNGLKLIGIYRSHFENLQSPGCGNVAFWLQGCLACTFIGCNPSSQSPAFGSSPDGSTIGFKLIKDGEIYCNANAFINDVVEYGSYGYDIADQAGQGSNLILGGTIEAQSTYAIRAVGCGGLQIIGTHLESIAGRPSGIKLDTCNDCLVAPAVGTSLELVGCKRTRVYGAAWLGGMTIDADCNFTDLDGFSYANGAVSSITNYSPTTKWGYLYNATNANFHAGREFPKEESINIFVNPKLDRWSGSTPEGLSSFGTPTLTKCGSGQADTTAVPGHTYSLKIEKTSVIDYEGIQTGDIAGLVVGDWVVIEAIMLGGTVGCLVLGLLDAGSGVLSYSAGGSATNWEYLVISFKVQTTFSALSVLFSPSTGTAGTFYLGGLKILVNGKKYVAKNSGTATVANGATTVVVSHGLTATPTRVQLTATLWSSAAKAWVTTKTATQFTINVNADPGAGTAIFDWEASVGEGT